MFRIKRVYEAPGAEDGYRVLVDRVWPRGLSRDAAAIDLWLKEVAPSTELRKWFGHDPERWPEFAARYQGELATAERAAALQRLREAQRAHGTVTLLYGARDETRNQAAVLAAVLNEQP